VFEGVNIVNDEKCVIKVLKPVKKKKIKREIKILQNLAGGPNIIQLLDVVRDPTSKIPSLVTEFVNNIDFKVLYPRFEDHDVRYYMLELLKVRQCSLGYVALLIDVQALDFCHSKGIMHRDVKPHNVMIDHETKKVMLFHLQHYVLLMKLRSSAAPHRLGPGRVLPSEDRIQCTSGVAILQGPRATCRLPRVRLQPGPVELWMHVRFNGRSCPKAYRVALALTVWQIFRKEPFFHGHDNYDQLVKITKVLGTDEFFEYVHKYDISLDPQYDDILGR
jgi:casein kinase II subunit alpha